MKKSIFASCVLALSSVALLVSCKKTEVSDKPKLTNNWTINMANYKEYDNGVLDYEENEVAVGFFNFKEDNVLHAAINDDTLNSTYTILNDSIVMINMGSEIIKANYSFPNSSENLQLLIVENYDTERYETTLYLSKQK